MTNQSQMTYAATMAEAPAAGNGASHSTMRELNRSLVLDVLRGSSPASRASIAKQTRLAKPTVSAIVDDLLSEGLVTELGPGAPTSEGGRPPIMLEFNARSRFFVGIHVGVQRTRTVVVDARGHELAREQFETPQSFRATMAAVTDSVRSAMNSANGGVRRLGAVGVCVPGLVDLEQGVCLLAPNLGWRDVPVRENLNRALGAPVHVHNTAQACAVAETLEGAAHDADDVVLLYAGTGVGAGIVIRGHLYRGVAGVAGEAGHVRVAGARDLCSCGRIGCLETLVSVPAVVRAAQAAGLDDGAGSLTLEDIVRLSQQGDNTAQSVLERAGYELGLAASWMVNLLNPEVLVIGGAIAGAGDFLMGPLRAAVVEHSLTQATERLAIRPWSLGQEAKLRGAVLVAMQEDDRSVRLAFGGGPSTS